MLSNPLAPIHPGEILRDDTMPGHGWDVKSLAEKLNVDEKKVSDLVYEQIPIDQDMSERLGKLLDIDKNFWLRFQQGYEMELIEKDLKIQMLAAGTPIKFDEVNKQKTVLAAFSATKPDAKISPVHAQKIIFKIDQEVNKSKVWIPDFKFVPHKHGPFDYQLNNILNRLADECLVDITYPPSAQDWKNRKYVLNVKGRKIGAKFLTRLPEDVKNKVVKLVEWAMKLSAKRLISEICNQYPEYVPEDI